MGGEGRGAKTSATLFDRFQKNIKSLSFSSNNIKNLFIFHCYGKNSKTKKDKEMIKDDNRRGSEL